MKEFKLKTPYSIEAPLTIGQKAADKVASVAGSWKFVIGFCLFLIVWVLCNTLSFINHWDQYPFILLNLFLSMIAAIQAPIIMMSQNRQAEIDRKRNANDYEVNLHSEEMLQELHRHEEEQNKMIKQLIDQNQELISYINSKEKKDNNI